MSQKMKSFINLSSTQGYLLLAWHKSINIVLLMRNNHPMIITYNSLQHGIPVDNLVVQDPKLFLLSELVKNWFKP